MKWMAAQHPSLTLTSYKDRTHPDAVLLPVLFPGPACVAVEEHVAADPVRAAVAPLCGHRRHLHPVPEVQLEPRLAVRDQGRPTAGSWGVIGKRETHNIILILRWNYFNSRQTTCGWNWQTSLTNQIVTHWITLILNSKWSPWFFLCHLNWKTSQ